jgi:hypothetical protein
MRISGYALIMFISSFIASCKQEQTESTTAQSSQDHPPQLNPNEKSCFGLPECKRIADAMIEGIQNAGSRNGSVASSESWVITVDDFEASFGTVSNRTIGGSRKLSGTGAASFRDALQSRDYKVKGFRYGI